MTKDEAITLEALKYAASMGHGLRGMKIAPFTIKSTLEQPAQEPVAWGVFEGNLHDLFFTQAEAQEMAALKGSHAKVRPLYTTPQPRPWVGLTDEEINSTSPGYIVRRTYARAIERALREKNVILGWELNNERTEQDGTL